MRVLFVAHDMGGGNLLATLARQLRCKGHALNLVANGPALNQWRKLGLNPTKIHQSASNQSIALLLSKAKPQLIVTGTSIGARTEKRFWHVARILSAPTIAMIDGWVKIPERFAEKRTAIRALPNRFGVVDRATGQELRRILAVAPNRIDVIGHPYLQEIVGRLRAIRSTKNAEAPFTVTFFSTPLISDEADWGLAAFHSVVEVLQKYAPLRVLIRPHPREQLAPWKRWIIEHSPSYSGLAISLEQNKSSESLLQVADAAIGLPTSVMIEAALSGVPSLVIRLDELNWPKNTAFETYLHGHEARRLCELNNKIFDLLAEAGKSEEKIRSSAVLADSNSGIKAIKYAAQRRISRR